MESGITGIVLAGGRSRRFGSDKLASDVGGRPLVEHAIDALATVADEVVVVIAADAVPGTADAPGQGSGPVQPGVRAVHAAAAVRPWLRIVRDGIPDAGPLRRRRRPQARRASARGRPRAFSPWPGAGKHILGKVVMKSGMK